MPLPSTALRSCADAIEFRTRLLARGDDLLLGQKPALAAEFYSLALNYDLKARGGSLAHVGSDRWLL